MTAGAFGVSLGSPREIAELVASLGGTAAEALAARAIARVVPPGPSEPTDLVVVASARYAEAARRGEGVLIAEPALAASLPAARLWVHDHPWWVVAALVRASHPPPVHAGAAFVEDGARVDATALLGTGAVIRSGAAVGARSVIGEYAVIFGGVTIGSDVVVGPHAVIGRTGFGWASGPDTVLRIPHGGGVVIEDGADIGPLCTIDAGTLSPTHVGRGARLDAHVHVAHNVAIGAGTFVAAQSGFAGSARVGNGVLVGGQTGVADHVTVGDGARVAAKSGVIGDVPRGVTVAGFPAVPRMQWLRAVARSLGRHSKKP